MTAGEVKGDRLQALSHPAADLDEPQPQSAELEMRDLQAR
jgi:hypothetical protein